MISVGILHSRRQFLDLHMSSLNKCKNKDKFKVFLLTQSNGVDYCNDLCEQYKLNSEVVEFSYHNNFMEKVKFLINSDKYSIRMDEDLFINHHIIDYMIDNIKMLDDVLLMAPTFITGVPTFDIFYEDYKNLDIFNNINNILQNTIVTETANSINPDRVSYGEYQKTKSFFNLKDNEKLFEEIGKIDYHYRGFHPIRINDSAHNQLIDYVINTNLLFEKHDYNIKTYKYNRYPYYCNHIHFIKNEKWKAAIEEFGHGFDEVSLNEYRKHYNLDYTFVHHGLCVHFMYSNLCDNTNIDNPHSNINNHILEKDFYERVKFKYNSIS